MIQFRNNCLKMIQMHVVLLNTSGNVLVLSNCCDILTSSAGVRLPE